MNERPRAMLTAGVRAGKAKMRMVLREKDRLAMVHALCHYEPPQGRQSERVMASLEAVDLLKKVEAWTGTSLEMTGFEWGTMLHVLASYLYRNGFTGNDDQVVVTRWIMNRRMAHPLIGPWLRWEREVRQARHAVQARVAELEQLQKQANAELQALMHRGAL